MIGSVRSVLIDAEHRAARSRQRLESTPPSARACGSAAACGRSARCRRRSGRSARPRREISAPMRSKSATSSAPGIVAARSICRLASCRIEWPNSCRDVLLDVVHVAARLGRRVDLHRVQRRQQLATGSAPIARSKMSDVECAGSVETSSTRLPHPARAQAPSPRRRSSCRRRPCRRRTGPARSRSCARAPGIRN